MARFDSMPVPRAKALPIIDADVAEVIGSEHIQMTGCSFVYIMSAESTSRRHNVLGGCRDVSIKNGHSTINSATELGSL